MSSVQGQNPHLSEGRYVTDCQTGIHNSNSQNTNKAAIQRPVSVKNTKSIVMLDWNHLHVELSTDVLVQQSGGGDFLRRICMLTNQWTTVIIFVLVIGALLPQPSSIHIIHGYLKQSFSKIGILHSPCHIYVCSMSDFH